MNLHPLFVHFPVALLTLYAVIEIVSIRKLSEKPYWFPLKAIILILGAISAIPALGTGLYLKNQAKALDYPISRIMELHELFGILTLAAFGLLALFYAINWISKNRIYNSKLWTTLVKISNILQRRPVAIITALIGLALITITGGLGGAMTHGLQADPFIAPILKFLFKL